MEAVEDVSGLYIYARGDATRAYHPTKVSLFTRELIYLKDSNVLVVFDRVHSTQAEYKKAWLLHGVNEPEMEKISQSTGQNIGHGGIAFSDAQSFTFREGQGQLRVHCLLPREREVVKRGGPGWEYWTPGDASGGAWGSGRNWPLIPFAGGLLPEDAILLKMWKTFWGQELGRILPSNSKAVVPGAWRIEVSPRVLAREDLFLHVLEIQDAAQQDSLQVEAIDGYNMAGARIGNRLMVFFARDSSPVTEAEVSVPDGSVESGLFTGMQPNAQYELQLTDLGAPRGRLFAEANEAGVIRFPFHGYSGGRLRIRRIQ